jgi:hypothetical protein
VWERNLCTVAAELPRSNGALVIARSYVPGVPPRATASGVLALALAVDKLVSATELQAARLGVTVRSTVGTAKT